jgi:hypothetical protein
MTIQKKTVRIRLVSLLAMGLGLLPAQQSRAESDQQSVRHGLALVEEIQLRNIDVGGFPNPACNILGIGTEKTSGRLLLAPEAGIILAGTYLSTTSGESSEVAMALGAGVAVRTQIGFKVLGDFCVFTRPELSFIALFGQNRRWAMAQLGTDFSLGYTAREFTLYLDIFRVGVQPPGYGSSSVAFGRFYPGFGLRYYFGRS